MTDYSDDSCRAENQFNTRSCRRLTWAGRPAWYTAANGCWLKIARLAGRIEPDMREGTSVLRRVAGSNPARSTRISPARWFYSNLLETRVSDNSCQETQRSSGFNL